MSKRRASLSDGTLRDVPFLRRVWWPFSREVTLVTFMSS